MVEKLVYFFRVSKNLDCCFGGEGLNVKGLFEIFINYSKV